MSTARWIAAFMIVCTIIPARVAGAQNREGEPAAPFEPGTWLTSITGSALAEAWNYNESREELYGLSLGARYEMRQHLAVGVEAFTGYVSQRGVDAFMVGWLGGVRWRVFGRGRRTVSLDLDVGMARSELPVPPRGTRFNYLFRPGATAAWPLTRGVFARAGLTWLHLSNNSLAGAHRNPDIQGVGVTAGVLLPF
jgi:hypothetical protein